MQTQPARVGELPPTLSGNSRRRDVRVAAPPELQARLAGQRLDLAVRDISLGGLSVDAGSALPLKSVYVIFLKLGELSILSRVRTVHCRQNRGRWVIGFAFVEENPCGRDTIATLMDAVLSSTIVFV